MSEDKNQLSNTALIIPDGRTRIFDKYPELKGIEIPAKDMFIGKMSSLCRQYAMKYYPDNWYILTTNNNKGQPQLVRYDEKIDGDYDNPPYPIPGINFEDGSKAGQPKYWKPFTDQLKQLEDDIKRLRIRNKYSRIHFLGNGIQNKKQWQQEFWDNWIQEKWNGLSEDERNNKDLDIYNVYKSGEFEYSLYCDVIEKIVGDSTEKIWLEYPLLGSKTKPEMISRITDAIYRGFPLRNNLNTLETITINNLFGMNNPAFTYKKIPLKNRKGIQVLTAPNGFGKSTIFRLLRSVLRGNLKEIADIPFDCLELVISDGKQPYTLIISKHKLSNGENERITISSGIDDDRPFKIKRNELKNPSDTGWDEWKYRISRELSKKIPPSSIRFLSSDRLWYDPLMVTYPHDLLTDWDAVFSKPDKTRIEQFSKSLSRRIEGTLNNYASTSHEIDTSFPLFDMKREDEIVRKTGDVYKEYDKLNERFEALHKEREFNEMIDFLPYRRWYRKAKGDKSEEVDPFQFSTKHDLDKINTLDYQAFLDFYLRKQEEKYSVFRWLGERCKLFKDLLENLFIYSRVRIQQDTGFTFYQKFETKEQKRYYHDLGFNQLSSGEKHQVVLLYDLLFNCDPGTLVFIDEPEISNHIVWQDQFADNLKKISEKNHISFLIATHSTDIIGANWDITTDLIGGSYS